MNLATSITDHVDTFAEDEFQANIMHRSNTIAFCVTQVASVWLAAAIAWWLPSSLAIVSFLAIVPPTLGFMTSYSWSRKRIPYPLRINWGSRPEIIMTSVGALLWIAGLIYQNIQSDAYADPVVGPITTVIIPFAGAVLLAPVAANILHNRDTKQLNKELEDD